MKILFGKTPSDAQIPAHHGRTCCRGYSLESNEEVSLVLLRWRAKSSEDGNSWR